MKQLSAANTNKAGASLATRQQGVGMVEVLVAVLILSIGVLGFAGMQLKALRSTSDNFYRSQATVLAGDIVARIAVNPGMAGTYATAASWSAAPVSDAATPGWWNNCAVTMKNCNAAAIAAWDIKQAAWMVAHLLPSGRAQVAQCDGSSNYCVTVAWNKTTVANCDLSTATADDGENKECVVLQVVP